MTIKLTEKRRAFLERMAKGNEETQWGFELLLERADFAEFFDHLYDFGLFAAANNPAPVAVEGGKYVPYWSALDYLEACAKLAGETNDLALSHKVLRVLRDVTNTQISIGELDNYHTNRKFSEILGYLPTACVSEKDIDLIPAWLNGRFERGMVCHALDLGVMKRFLESEEPTDWLKACRVLRYCTAIKWVDEPGLESIRRKPVTVVDDYWLNKFIDHHVHALAIKARSEAVDVFLQRLKEVYSQGDRAKASWLFRPAIEEHKQNHKWGGADNCFVVGLRDALLAWVETDADNARSYIAILLRDNLEIVRRVALRVLNQQWQMLEGLFVVVIPSLLFESGLLHELYGLLRDRFALFSETEKAATVAAIRNIPQLTHAEDPIRTLRMTQRKWLSAIAGQGSEAADSWCQELQSDPSLGQLSDHPDFHTYMESFWGPGPSPFQSSELIEFAKEGSLVSMLNDFSPKDPWRGSSRRALVDTLEAAVAIAPAVFLSTLPEFLAAQRAFQYGIINGFKNLWEAPKDKPTCIDWDLAWDGLISFFEELLNDNGFWTESAPEDQELTPTRDWIPPLVSDFLRAGVRNDDKAYDQSMLPRGWGLIRILLEKSKTQSEVSDDPMTEAINSAKGKAIEALFVHALRMCRLSDRVQNGVHTDAWITIKPTFDSEVAKCRGTNFEFSTLAGAYLANINYINSEWLSDNIDRIFPEEYSENFRSAVGGLGYAPATRPIFRLLAENGALDTALALEGLDSNARERLVERIALAYLWADEELVSTRFTYLFIENCEEDLCTVSNFFWALSNQELAQAHITRILTFWEKCIEWSRNLTTIPARLLSSLSRLSIYLTEVGATEAALLEYVAKYAYVDHNSDEFIEQLLRLTEVNLSAVCRSFAAFLDSYLPTDDYEGKLQQLIRRLAVDGFRLEAITFADRLHRLPGMLDLSRELIDANP